MNNACIAIYDDEIHYAFHLMEYLCRSGRIPYEVRVFTGAEKLLHFQRTGRIRALIVAESEYAGAVADADFPGVLILNESDRFLGDGVPNISKYRSTDDILTCLLQRCLPEVKEEARATRHQGPLHILGVYTPLRRCLQTTFALTMGQLLAAKAPTLYLNFEEYSGLEGMLGRSFRGSVSDLLYYNECAREKVAGELGGMVETLGDLHFLPTMRSYIELRAIRGDQWVRLFETIGEVTEYAYLLLDLTEAVEGLADILRVCEKVYMIEREDPFSRAKLLQYEALLEALHCEDVYARTMHVRLPVFRQLPGNLEFLTHGELARYCRQLLRA